MLRKSSFQSNKIIKIISLFFILIIFVIYISNHDFNMYHQPIGQIVKVYNYGHQNQSDEFGNTDYVASQKLELQMLNTNLKGRSVTIYNKYSGSHAYDSKYFKGQEVFLEKNDDKYVVQGLKRDTQVFVVLTVVLFLIILIARKDAIMSIVSVILNATFFFIATQLDIKVGSNQVTLLYSLTTILFLITTTLFVYGRTKTSKNVCISSLVTCLLTLSLIEFNLYLTRSSGLHFETMSYVTQSRTILYIFSIIIGMLGAIVDVSGDITVTLINLFSQEKNKNFYEIFQVGLACGKTLLMPSVNILSLIFVSSTLPMMILFIKNGNDILYSISMIMSLGIFQILSSVVGLLITVPITSLIVSHDLIKMRINL
ncbi:YibE/F family protein [Leuconostoc suionicum]|uniref:YibE/F family protein n=1 Tax=Leuconostoc suionicum TaxID=1511761 RepID=UPI003748E1ED